MSWLKHQLGLTVREERQRRGWSQEQLAAASSLDRSYVGEIERGAVSPTLATLEKLAAGLEIAPSVLIERCEARREQRA